MPPSAKERFLIAANELGVVAEVQYYPEGTRTAEDAAAAVGCAVAQIVKSMIFMADDAPVLALTAGSNRVDPDGLGRHLGATVVRRADADEVRAATGFAIGGTPPFGHPSPLPTVIDPTLLEADTVWAAGGTPDSCFPIVPTELVRITEAAPSATAFTG